MHEPLTNASAAFSVVARDPFSVEWPAGGQFPGDVSFLFHAPVGNAGFIRAKAGHLVLPDGTRFRIWGLNATMQAGLPSKEHAPVVADNLARRGVNCAWLNQCRCDCCGSGSDQRHGGLSALGQEGCQ
jgi:hypothetical protein